jgi:amino acid transporter
MRNMTDSSEHGESRQRSFLSAVVAVLCAFVGIRKGSASLADQGIKPAHVVLAALVCVLALIACIVTIVHLVIASVR